MDTIEERVRQAGLAIPPSPVPLGAYVTGVRTGNLLFLSGMLPLKNGAPLYAGRVGDELDIEEGREAVVCALLNALAVTREHAGGLDQVRRIVRMSLYLRTGPDFGEHAAVADAASRLLLTVFGEAGQHARQVFGVHTLPVGIPVEIDLIVEVK